jgi:Spy/CpxP family protein refolding chaperone
MGFFSLVTLCSMAQDTSRMHREDMRKKMEAMESAYLTRELNLTPEEAQKFWPVYNQYKNEARGIMRDKSMTDPLDKQQKFLDLRKKYRNDFAKILTMERANKLYQSEDNFRAMVRREWMERKGQGKPGEGSMPPKDKYQERRNNF